MYEILKWQISARRFLINRFLLAVFTVTHGFVCQYFIHHCLQAHFYDHLCGWFTFKTDRRRALLLG